MLGIVPVSKGKENGRNSRFGFMITHVRSVIWYAQNNLMTADVKVQAPEVLPASGVTM